MYDWRCCDRTAPQPARSPSLPSECSTQQPTRTSTSWPPQSPAGRRAILHTRAQAALSVPGENADALREILADALQHPGPLTHLAALMEGSDVTYGPGPLIGTWAPDTLDQPAATYAVEHLRTGRPMLIDATDGGELTATTDPWRHRLDVVEAPGTGTSALVRPDGYLAWASDAPQGLPEALVGWIGTP